MKHFLRLLIFLLISNTCLSQQLKYPLSIISHNGEILLKDRSSFGLKGKVKTMTAVDKKGIKYYQLKFDKNGNLINKTIYNKTSKNDAKDFVVLTHHKNSIECVYKHKNDSVFRKINNKYNKGKKIIESESFLRSEVNLTYDYAIKTIFKYQNNDLKEKILYKKKGLQNDYKLLSQMLFSRTDSLNYIYEKQRIIEYGMMPKFKSYEYTIDVLIKKNAKDQIVSKRHKKRNGNFTKTLFEYDISGNTIKEKTSFYSTSPYTYKEALKIVKETIPNSKATTYKTYDKDHRIVNVRVVKGNNISEQKIEYDKKGNWITFTYFRNGIDSNSKTIFEIEYFD